MQNKFAGLTRNLSSRLILAFVAIIIATTIAAGIPSLNFIDNELEKQAWAHVKDGSHVTETLMQYEKENLRNLASLTANRPTLMRYLMSGDIEALRDYLQTYLSSIDLDIIILRDSVGNILSDELIYAPWTDLPIPADIAFYARETPSPSVALLACQPIVENQTGDIIGSITLGHLIDDEFALHLSDRTGFEQSIVLGTTRIASSLPGGSNALDHEGTRQRLEYELGGNIEVTIQGIPYFTSFIPIHGEDETIIAYIEVAQSVSSLIAAEQRALLTMTLSTILVIIVGSSLGGFIASRLTHPLSELTNAATRFSHGDLETPFPLPHEPKEIATLASSLEESRVNIQHVLENLSLAKAWSETLIQSIAEGIVTFDDDARIVSFSHGAEQITGWLSDEVINQSINDVFCLPEGEGKLTEHISPQGGTHQIELLSRSGQSMKLAITVAQLIPPEGECAQTALVLRDITEEEAVQNLRSYFLANISHEFRTPLSAINASVELLLEDLGLLSIAEISELLNSIHMSVSGLQALIDNLLESISIQAGRFQIRPRPTNLETVIQEAVRMMDPLLNRRQQHLSIDETAQLQRVYADPTRLTQVMVNLLSNASKYSPIGADIDISIDTMSDILIRISVADRGPGIHQVERSEIFRRFVRLDNQDGAQHGVGLGLSVVKVIVEEHGGQVGVEDRPSGGSIFWFTLPLKGDSK